MLLEEGVGQRLAIALEVSESLAAAVLGVRLQAERELAAQVRCLSDFYGTIGLEVVWLQKVDPVGLMVGGNFDL